MKTRFTLVVVLVLAVIFGPVSLGMIGLADEIPPVKAIIFAMFEAGDYRGDFPGEFQYWVEGFNLDQHQVEVPGAYAPVLYNDDGVYGTVIGVGKSEAAASVTAVLLDPRFDFSEAYFITSGCAGTPPSVGTLGAVFWADWVVDYDLGHRMSPEEGTPFQPLECNPATDPNCKLTCPEAAEGCKEYTPRAFKLNEDFVAWAYYLSKDVELADSEAAQNYRALYTEETARRAPFVGIGTTMCGDCYFHGPRLSMEAQYICDLYGAGIYKSTEMEDHATATVLARFGYLDRYLSERDVVNFDQPHLDQTTQDSLETSSGAFKIGMENAYRAGSVVVNYIVQNWEVWKSGVPEPPMVGVGAQRGKTVIHHTAAFGGELELLKELMTTMYGESMVVEGELGRVYYVWETGPKTRLIGSITQTSMQNATLSPALILYALPEVLRPDLVTHGGICGAVWEESKIMDVYSAYAVAFSTQGLYGPEGFSPFGMGTWDPEIGTFLDREHSPIWCITDPVLTELLAEGFDDAIADPGFQELWSESGLPYQPSLYEGVIQVASNYFVANDELNASWAELYRMDPDTIDVNKVWGDYDGQVHEVGGLDMETAAVVWTFKQAGIPTAVLRYPSDLARAEASVQIQQFGQTASAVGGYAFFYGLQNVIAAIEDDLLTVVDGRCVFNTTVESSSP